MKLLHPFGLVLAIRIALSSLVPDAILILALALWMVVVPPASGDPGCPGCSIVPNLVYCPTADYTYKVTVIGDLGPVSGASVEVRLLAAFNSVLCWTAAGDPPAFGVKKSGVVSFVTIADDFGVATYHIGAGGCIPFLTSAIARRVEVFANSVKIGDNKGGVSPDCVDQNGKLPFEPGYAPTQCEVGLSDSSYLTPAFKGTVTTGNLARCGDLNSSGATTLADVVLFTPHSKGSHSSPRL